MFGLKALLLKSFMFICMRLNWLIAFEVDKIFFYGNRTTLGLNVSSSGHPLSMKYRSSSIAINIIIQLCIISYLYPQVVLFNFFFAQIAGSLRRFSGLDQNLIELTHKYQIVQQNQHYLIHNFIVIIHPKQLVLYFFCINYLIQMKEHHHFQERICQSIKYIERKQRQMENIRLDLNHQIMFNLRDTYLHISNRQNSINIKHLAEFLNISDSSLALEKLVKWNNHSSSLNLTFAQFSAIIITKENKLLAKMVLEREQMGAIPNFLLEKVKSILYKQLQIHEFCSKWDVNMEQELKEWIEKVIDENGDLCQDNIEQFISQYENSSSNSSFSSTKENNFMAFLQSSGNITGQRLLFLWKGSNQFPQDISSKFHKLSTNISSPKSLMPSQSCQNLRSQFYDCLNRPLATDISQIRETKSIEKHINRINSQKRLNIISKFQKNTLKQKKSIFSLLQMLKLIIQIEKQTQNARIELRLCPDFYPILFYQSIPKDRNKNTTPNNFRDYLESFGYFVEINQVYFLFRRYSNCSILNFNSFCTIFDTIAKEFNLLQKNRFVQSLQDISYTTKRCYFSLILLIIKNQIKINQIKLNFCKRINSMKQSINYLFQIFGRNQGQLNQHQFKDIFQQILQINLTINDIRMILRRCKRNKGDQIILKQNLIREIIPYTNKLVNK